MSEPLPAAAPAQPPPPPVPRPPATPRSLGFKAKNLRIKEFNSEELGAVEAWLAGIELAVRADETEVGAQWPQRALYYAVGGKLRGNATQWFIGHDKAISDPQRTFTHLKESLMDMYGSRHTVDVVTSRLNKRVRQSDETFGQYAAALRAMCTTVEVPQTTLIHCFLEGLSPEASHLIRGQSFPTVERAIRFAESAFSKDWTADGDKTPKKRVKTMEKPPAPRILDKGAGSESESKGQNQRVPVFVMTPQGVPVLVTPTQGDGTVPVVPQPGAAAYPAMTATPFYSYPWALPATHQQYAGQKRGFSTYPGAANPHTKMAKPSKAYQCWHCGQWGHVKSVCASRRRGEAAVPKEKWPAQPTEGKSGDENPEQSN